jgi:hypothetical protein
MVGLVGFATLNPPYTRAEFVKTPDLRPPSLKLRRAGEQARLATTGLATAGGAPPMVPTRYVPLLRFRAMREWGAAKASSRRASSRACANSQSRNAKSFGSAAVAFEQTIQ